MRLTLFFRVCLGSLRGHSYLLYQYQSILQLDAFQKSCTGNVRSGRPTSRGLFWGVEAILLFTVQTADKILKCVLSYGTNDHVVGKFRIKERKETYINKFRYGIIETDPYWGTQRYLGMDMNKVIWRLADIMLLRAECRAVRITRMR